MSSFVESRRRKKRRALVLQCTAVNDEWTGSFSTSAEEVSITTLAPGCLYIVELAVHCTETDTENDVINDVTNGKTYYFEKCTSEQ